MDAALPSLDWSLVQAFLAVAETGSLSAAARKLGRTQPTLGRQVKAMEEQLGASLFLRQARGLDLTETGRAILPAAQSIQAEMQKIKITAAGREVRLEGAVRITASVSTSLYHLPTVVRDIREALPGVSLDLVPSDATSNLLFREADIAVRMYRPTQLDLITQHIGDIPLGIFAARDYIERVGMPETLEDLMQMDWIGQDKATMMLDGMRQVGIQLERSFFPVRTDDFALQWELLRAGCGIAITQRPKGVDMPELVEIPSPLPLPTLPIWLTAHEAIRQTPRIRAVWDLLVAGLRREVFGDDLDATARAG